MAYRGGKLIFALTLGLVVGGGFWLAVCRGQPDGGSAQPAATPGEQQVSEAGPVALRPGEREALILYSGALHGMIEACGCPGNPSGGMSKEFTIVERVRQRGLPSLYLNPGDLFPFDKRPAKMKFIAESAAVMGYDALAIGDQELVEGLPRFRELAMQHRLPYLSENLRGLDGERIAPGYTIKELAGIKVGIFAIMGDESYLYYKSDALAGIKIEPAVEAVRTVLAQLKGQVDYIIMLSHQDRYLDREIAERFQEINLIVGGHDGDQMTPPVLVGDSLRVIAAPTGEQVGILHLAIDPRRTVRVLGNELASVTAQVPASEKIEAVYREYVKASKEQSEVIADPLPEVYQSSQTCEPCHKKIYEDFLKTKHAQAWDTLVKAGRTEDRECWQCHSMGFGRKSGFRSIKETPELANVSCQACHLVTHDHSDRKIKDDLDYARDQRTCLQCHTVVTAPNFNYWEQVEKIDHHDIKEKSNDPPPGYQHTRVTPVNKSPTPPATDQPADKK